MEKTGTKITQYRPLSEVPERDALPLSDGSGCPSLLLAGSRKGRESIGAMRTLASHNENGSGRERERDLV